MNEIDGIDRLELIGSGANARVFCGYDVAHDREVAVKVLQTSAKSEDTIRRFDRERRAMGRLSRVPNIIDIYRSDVTTTGEPYLVMPYLPASLQTRLEGGLLTWREAAELMQQVATAIAAAHSMGVLHLDLKPGNVLIDEDGLPHVADFGIAEFIGATDSLSGAMLTPEYSPPERFDDVQPNELVDVYSLGATLFAALTGSAPFRTENNSSPQAMMRRIVQDPVPLDRLPDDVPDDLRRLIGQAMTKDPADRIQSASVFATALGSIIEGKQLGYDGLHAVPPGVDKADGTILRDELELPDGPRKLQLLGAVALLTALVGGATYYFVSDNEKGTELAGTADTLEVEGQVASAVLRQDDDNENDGIPFVERVRTLTINDGFDKIETTLLQTGGASMRLVEGDTRGELKSNGEYIHDRESEEAYTFGFVADELGSDDRILARWNIRVTVAAARDLVLDVCDPLEVQNLQTNVESSSVVVITWGTNTPATELVRSQANGENPRFSNPSGNFYQDFTHRLGDLAWSGIEPLEAGTEYTASITLVSQCDPTDSVTELVTFSTAS